MSRLKQQPFYFQIVVIGGFVFIGVMLFALGSSIYRDVFQVGGYIRESAETIERLQSDLADQPAELAYAQSPHYQEKIAKELLGRQLPGERVIVLTQEDQTLNDLLPVDLDQPLELEQLSNSGKWWRYLFGI